MLCNVIVVLHKLQPHAPLGAIRTDDDDDLVMIDINVLIRMGHLAALTRSHLIGDHPSGLTKEQTTETRDPISSKTKGLRHCPRR